MRKCSSGASRAAVIIGVSLAMALGLAGALHWRLSHRLTAEDYFRINVSKVRDTLSAADPRAVIFLGDSITHRAPLPAEICGHPVLNAGISGIDAENYVSLLGTIGDFRAAAIVVALGTNNARRTNTTNFAKDYATLLKMAAARAPKLVLVGLPPIEDGTETRNFDALAAEHIDREIQSFADRMKSPFVDLRTAMSVNRPLTIDGVHPSAEGFEAWLGAIEPEVAGAVCGARSG